MERENLKIAFPIDDNEDLDGYLAAHFGRAAKFVIFDSTNNEIKTIVNTGEHFGGRSSTPSLLHGNQVNILVCKGLGRKAIALFGELGIDVKITTTSIVKEALAAFKNGELISATEKDGCKDSKH
ncbi:MAG: NifB/NifX family molybdenum-iron cluster-binding protein [Candidatus Heimdallarchaeota archaeon]